MKNIEFVFQESPEAGKPYEITEGVYWFPMPLPMMGPDYVNCYILDDGQDIALVDTGANIGDCKNIWENTLKKNFPKKKISNVYAGTGYGLTETNATCSNFTGEAFRLRPDASGTVSPVVEIKTVDDEGKTLPTGETGEICIKSPTNARGYWNLAKESEKTFKDHWVSTGDLGFLNKEKLVNIVGRIKDVIIRGGENIYPAEIEAVLSNYPGVEEASVYGLQYDAWGEIVGATVFGIKINEEEIRNYVASQLAAFKVPEKIFISETPLERNAAGKLLAKKIKENSKDYQNDVSN